ncbi:hypothetical protein HKCCE3408_07235 [Rhodobacterales bacterium HKCCE3408]|nr:hypothetical protein [Rhodobacterales bacterium HKCCE3408]
MITSFMGNQSGTVSVPWVVLTAGIVALSVSVFLVVAPGTANLSCEVAAEMASEASRGDAGEDCTNFQVAMADARTHPGANRPRPQPINPPADTGADVPPPDRPADTPYEPDPILTARHDDPSDAATGSGAQTGGTPQLPDASAPVQVSATPDPTPTVDTPAPSTPLPQVTAPVASADWSGFVPLDPHHREAYGTAGVDANGRTWVEATYATWSTWSDAQIVSSYHAAYAAATASKNNSRARRGEIDNVTVLEQIMVDRGIATPAGNQDAATLRAAVS